MGRSQPEDARSGLLGTSAVILVAVGTQFPFDRLVEAVDRWAGSSGARVIAQIGPSTYQPRHIEAHPFLPPRDFQALVKTADLLVAHCGMGSILSALSVGKPILVMPRLASRGEHRNDHQVATAQRFSARAGVTIAWDEAELLQRLDQMGRIGESRAVPAIAPKAPRELTDRLRRFLREGTR